MAEQRPDPAQIAGTVDWLEDEHRQLRARVGRLEQEIEQLAAAGREQTLRQRADAADLEALRQHLNRVPGLEETIRLVQEDVGDLRSLLTRQTAAGERGERAFALELDRVRLTIAEISQRLATLVDEVQPLPVRIQALGDHGRRVQDQLTDVQRTVEEILGRQSTVQSKIDLSVEQTHRVEQGLAAVGGEFAPLRRQDEVLASRIQIAIDLARQVEGRMVEALAEEQARRELAERVEILRAERQRIQQQLADLEHASAGLIERTDELGRLLRQETDRRRTTDERVGQIEGRFLNVRQTTNEAIIALWQAAEERKRQEIGLLQDQAKALRDTLKRLTRPDVDEE